MKALSRREWYQKGYNQAMKDKRIQIKEADEYRKIEVLGYIEEEQYDTRTSI